MKFLEKMFPKKQAKAVQAKPLAPANGYMAARQEWLERFGSYIQAAAQWRFFALALMVLLLLSITGNVLQIKQLKVIAYLAQIDGSGRVQSVDRLAPQTSIPRVLIQSELANFVVNWRTVTADFDLQKRMVNKLSAFTVGAAKGQLRQWYEKNSPYNAARNGRLVQIEVKGLPLPVSESSWRIEWQEITRSHTGILLNTENFEATLNIMIQPPENEIQILHNPGGIMVREITFNKILNQEN